MTHILNSVGLTNITDTSDVTKTIAVSLSGATTGTSTTFSLAQTANRTITFPNVTTTMVGTDATQSLTNKTITDATNAVTATGLRTATTTVAVSPAAAPSANQALVATSGTAATWQALSSAIFANSGVGAGTYNFPVSITVNAAGIITAATSNQNLVTNVDAAANLGAPTLRWANLYSYNVHAGFNTTLDILSRLSTITLASSDSIQALSCYGDTDQYPIISIRTQGHDNSAVSFDAYVDSFGIWRSSFGAGNFSIQKFGTNLNFLNALGIINGNAITWNTAAFFDPRGAFLAQKYASSNATSQTGTSSQSGVTVTATTGTAFVVGMVGGIIVWPTGYAYITNFVSGTVLTVTPSQSIASSTHFIYYGMYQMTRGDVGMNRLLIGPGQQLNTPTKLVMAGPANDQVNGPHMRAYLNADQYPSLEFLNFSHDNIGISFDGFYNGTNWTSSLITSNFQIYKVSNSLQFNYSSGAIAGNTLTWTNGFSMDTSGKLSNMKLLTTGGTASVFDYYEEATLADTTSGAFASAISIKIIRIGKVVTVRFPTLTGSAAVNRLFLTSASTFPTRFRPPAITSWIVPVTNNSVLTNGDLTWEPSIVQWFVSNTNNTNFTGGTCGYTSDMQISYVLT